MILSWLRGRGVGGECPEAKTPYLKYLTLILCGDNILI